MAEYSGFFKSYNGDRKYCAEDFARRFANVFANGVMPNGAQLFVSAGEGMRVSVSAGFAWINGYDYYNDADFGLSIDVADGVLPRIDRVALRWSRENRSINLAVLKGTPASEPEAPALQRDADAWELGLAAVQIPAGATQVEQAYITDTRPDSSLCGLSSLVSPLPSDAWFSQFQAMFDEWFQTLQGVLEGDIAGNLATQIAALQSHTSDILALKSIASFSVAAEDWTENVEAVRSEAVIVNADITPETRVHLVLDDSLKGKYALWALDPAGGSVTICAESPPSATLTGRIIIEEVRA